MPRRPSINIRGANDPLEALGAQPDAGRNSMPLGNDPAAQMIAAMEDANAPVNNQPAANQPQQVANPPQNVQPVNNADEDDIIGRILEEYANEENAGQGNNNNNNVDNANPAGDNNQQQQNNDNNNNAQQNNNAQPQAAPQPQNQPFHHAPYTEKDRAETLKTVFVTNYKHKKENEDMKWVDIRKDEMPENDVLKQAAKMDSHADYAFYASLAGSVPPILASVGNSAFGMVGPKGAAESVNNFYNKNGTQDVMNAMSLAGNVGSAVYGGLKYRANRYRAKNDKNANHREVAKLRKTAGIFNALNGITGAMGNATNMGIFGSRPVYNGKPNEGSTVQKTSGVLDVLTAATGFGGKLFDFLSTRKRQKLHKETANKAKNIKDAAVDADQIIANSSTALHEMGGIGEPNQNILAKRTRQQRHTAKAQKYAMEMAEKLHSRKSTGTTKDWLGLAGSGLGLLGSLVTAGAKWAGKAGGPLGAIGGMMSAAGGGAAFGGNVVFDKMITGYRRGKKYKADKKQLVDEYLAKKVDNIKREAPDVALTQRQEEALGATGRAISDHEAKMLAVMRLGSNPKYKKNGLWEKIRGKNISEELTDEIYDAVFDVLLEKRANNIMQSSDKEKRAMFQALGLDDGASLEDVKAALNPDDAL